MNRPPVQPEDARKIIEALLARRFDGPLAAPAPTPGGTAAGWGWIASLPPAAALPLHGRAMFAPTTLDVPTRTEAEFARPAFFAELGAAVGVSARVLHAAVRARRFPLEPPRALAGYEYLGNFLCEGKLDIADPCHLRKTSRIPPAMFSLSAATEALAGTWHAYVRNGKGDAADRTAELAVIHERGFEAVAITPVANVAVDGGAAGVFDRSCPPFETRAWPIEGVVHGLGAYANSGYGDGIYSALAGRAESKVAKLRLVFLDEDSLADATLPVGVSRPYAASTTYVAGDTIEHPKFGSGNVLRVRGNKIDVEFDDDIRTFLHGKR